VQSTDLTMTGNNQ